MITHQRLQLIVLSIIFAVVTIIVVMMWWPYLTFVAMGAILSILFHPVYTHIGKRVGNNTVAALLTILLILMVVLLPLYLVGQLSFNELANLYGNYRRGGLHWNDARAIQELPGPLRQLAENFSAGLGQKLSTLASDVFASAGRVLSNVAGFFVSLFLVFFTTFYLLRDGQKIKQYLGSLFPLSPSHENLLVSKLELAISGVVKGMFLIALIQGGVGLVGYLIFGVPQPILWALFTVLAALVPTVGTSLAIIPAVIYLFLTNHVGAAVGMAIWGALAVGTIDNFVSPRIVGKRMELHPLLVLFSVIGGLQFFGILGVLLGPIIVAVFATLVEIYRTDLKEYLGK